MDDTWQPPEPAQRALACARTLLSERRIPEALAALEAARRLGAAPASSAGERWMCHMLLGDFEAAWRVSDEVLAAAAPETFNRRDLPFHLRHVWTGAPLAGRHVLVRCYHGLGDTIQFARYLPLLAGIARSVTVQVEPVLFGLLATVPGVERLVPLADDVAVPFEVDVEMMELPFASRQRADALPGVPYLSAPPAEFGDRRRIGLVWAAGDWDGGRRSVPPCLFAPLCRIPGLDWICLQRGDGLARLRAEDGLRFAEPVDAGTDLVATAARLQSLDLVITVDTMIAHLAGALAVPVWTLLPYAADWRWMVGRADSPWYPTMRLFRQPRPGDWQTPVAAMAAALG